MLKPLGELFDITFICPDPEPEKREEVIKKVEQVCTKVIVIPVSVPKKSFFTKARQFLKLVLHKYPVKAQNNYNSIFEAAIKKEILREKYDFIQTFSQVTAVYAGMIKKYCPNAKLIIGPGDDWFLHEKTKRQSERSLIKRMINHFELRGIVSWQNKYIQIAEYVLFFSMEDIQSVISGLKPGYGNKVIWMPGIIEYEDTWDENSLNYVEPLSIAFVGGMGMLFNRQAVIYFVDQILPIIHEHIKEAKFYVIGHNPGNKFTADNFIYKNQVKIVGSVESIREHLEKIAVFVSPNLSGAGIKTKVIEALRYGKPVVSTSRGVGGLWDHSAIIIRNKPKAFAKQVVRLLQDDNFRIKKSKESRRLYMEKYSYSVVSEQIKNIYLNRITQDHPGVHAVPKEEFHRSRMEQ